MAVVCAQSVALAAHAPTSWQWTENVVQDEGGSVGDIEGQVSLSESPQRIYLKDLFVRGIGSAI